MIAYKAFRPGLICRGYQFVMGLNVTDKANCARNGFHSAENPLDCLSYYPFEDSEFYLVDAGGDIDEDNSDSKISCTELRILKQLSPEGICPARPGLYGRPPASEMEQPCDGRPSPCERRLCRCARRDPSCMRKHWGLSCVCQRRPGKRKN